MAARCRRARNRRRRGGDREPGARRLEGRPGLGEGARSADRAAAARSPDRGERDPGRPEQGVGAAAALQGARPNGETVWYVLLDASDSGIAHDLGVNYAPKLGNLAIGDPEAVQTVTLDSPTPDQNKFGQAVVNFQGAPDFSPTRIAEPGPTGFPLAKLPAGRRRRPGLQPVHPDRRLADRVQRADRRDRRRPVRRRPPHEHRRPRARHPHRRPRPPGQYAESWVDLLFVKGFDAGQPIVYISTDAGQPLTVGARALDLRARARQGGLQRRRRLPRLRPRAAVRLHQRPDR